MYDRGRWREADFLGLKALDWVSVDLGSSPAQWLVSDGLTHLFTVRHVSLTR